MIFGIYAMNYLSYVPILSYAKILECVKRKKTIKINFNTRLA